jgi:pimeloyl-ACP methyl ester carboxylesterase
MSYADVNGISLYYEEHGSGQPLILLHGGLAAGDMYAPILPALAKDRRMITVDLQAHGHTADVDRPHRSATDHRGSRIPRCWARSPPGRAQVRATVRPRLSVSDCCPAGAPR